MDLALDPAWHNDDSFAGLDYFWWEKAELSYNNFVGLLPLYILCIYKWPTSIHLNKEPNWADLNNSGASGCPPELDQKQQLDKYNKYRI